MAFNNLFEPIKLGKLEVRNRVAFAPIGIGAYNDDETVNENYFPFIAERAKEQEPSDTTISTAKGLLPQDCRIFKKQD